MTDMPYVYVAIVSKNGVYVHHEFRQLYQEAKQFLSKWNPDEDFKHEIYQIDDDDDRNLFKKNWPDVFERWQIVSKKIDTLSARYRARKKTDK